MNLINPQKNNDILQIKALESEYDLVLRQYEEAHQNYIQYTKSGEATSFANLKGRSFWGKEGLKEGTAQTVEECEDMCLSNEKCTGATFNTDKRYCWTRSGQSKPEVSLDADIAIIPKTRQLIIQLKHYNTKLTQINKKLADYYSSIDMDTNNTNVVKQETLIKYNSQLEDERATLEQKEQALETINQRKSIQDTVATQGYTQFRFWLLLASILLLISMKMALTTADGESSPSMSIGVPILIIALLGVSFMLRSPQGFLIFGLIIFALIAIKMQA